MQGAAVILVGGAVLLGWGWVMRVSGSRGADEYSRTMVMVSKVAIPLGMLVLARGLVAFIGSLLE